MIVVSDTTAISNLLQIGGLELLQSLYGNIIIPESVKQELLVLKELGIDIEAILSLEWIEVVTIEMNEVYQELITELDKGETEAIVLALQLDSDYLLIDEKKGRKIAQRKQLKIIGTLGVLLEAKRNQLITSVEKKMDDLAAIGFWISPSLRNRVIEIEKTI